MIFPFMGLAMPNMPSPEEGGGASNISFVNSIGYASAGGALPSGYIDDDLFLGAAFRTDGVPTAPSLPSGEDWAVITPDSDISNTGGNGTTSGGRFSYKYANEPTESSGQWISAQTTLFGLYRGVHATTPVLSAKWNSGSGGSSLVWPALTHNNTGAWVVLFSRTQNIVTVTDSGVYQERFTAARRYVYDTAGVASTFSGATMPLSGNPGLWVTCAVALQSN